MVRGITAISTRMGSTGITTIAITIPVVSRLIPMVQTIPYTSKTQNITNTTWVANPP
jgi:hypothetical protein